MFNGPWIEVVDTVPGGAGREVRVGPLVLQPAADSSFEGLARCSDPMGGCPVRAGVDGEPCRYTHNDELCTVPLDRPALDPERRTGFVEDLLHQVIRVPVGTGESGGSGNLVRDTEDYVAVACAAVRETDRLVEEDLDRLCVGVALLTSVICLSDATELGTGRVFLEVQDR